MQTKYFWSDNGHIDDVINHWLSLQSININIRDIRFCSHESDINDCTIDTALVVYYT